MRILIAIPYFAPAWGYGGPTRLLFELTHYLAGVGHTVTVLTSDSADGPIRYAAGDFSEDHVRVIRLPVLSQRLAFRHKKFFVVAYLGKLKELLSSHEVLHLNGSRDFFVTIGALAARRSRKPYVLATYGCLPTTSRGWKAVAKPVFDSAFTRRTVRNAALCLAQTQHEARLCQQFGASQNRIRMVPLASSGERFRQLPERGSFRKGLGLTSHERLILFVGRINWLKGLDTLVRSFAQVSESNHAARLVVVGRDDGYELAIRKLVNEMGLQSRVLFVGPLYGRDVLSAYVDADVFALTPRHFEETTLAGLEACFCGTQVVATEQAEIPYLEASGAGRIVENNIDAITRALLAALENDAVINERGRAARAMAFQYFDWSVIAPLYVEAYQDALGEFTGRTPLAD